MRLLMLFLWMGMSTLPPGDSWAAPPDSVILKAILLEKEIMQASGDDTAAYSLLFSKAMLYKGAGFYQEGLQTLDRIHEEILPDSVQCQVHYERAFLLYMLNSYSIALQEIWSAEACGLDKAEQRMLYLMVLLENERWDEFKDGFLKEVEGTGRHATVFTIEDFKTPVLLDPEKYARKSRVPGMGLIASGHTGKGIISMCLQLACTGFAVYQFYYGYYFTGFFSGIQPARKFHNGGKTLSKALVRNDNRRQIELLKARGYEYLEKLY